MPGKELELRPAAVIVPQGGPAVPWQQQPASESAVIGGARWLKRNNHVTVPLGLLPGMWLAGLILHHVHAAVYTALAAAIVTACIWFFAASKWDRRAEQWYARLSAILGGGWLALAAWLGPLSGTIIPIALASVLAAGCIAWGVPWWKHKRPRGMKKHQRFIAECDFWWQSHCEAWNLRGSRVIDAKLSGVTLWMRIQGLPGRHSYDHFAQVIRLIESAAEGHSDIGLVRLGKVPGRPSQVDLFLKKQNPLRETVEYDMGTAPQSVHDLAPFGVSEAGEIAMRSLRRNRFTIGETRSGKSNDLLVGIAHLSGCPDGRYVLIDLKGGRSARPVLKSASAEYVITEIDEARMYTRMCVADIKARSTHAYDGNEQLHATEDTPGMWTMVDETYRLTATENGAGDPECRRNVADIASQGAGLEYYIWVFTQNGSLETSVGTEQIRANLPWRTCYRVTEARHGQYVIPEYAKLDASKLEENGTCYDKYGKDVTPEQIRRPLMDHGLLTRIASQNAALIGPRPPLRLYCGAQVAYQVTAGRDEDGNEIRRAVTWQEWWDARWTRLPEAFRKDSPQYQAAVAEHPYAAAEVIEQARHATQPVPSPEPGTGDARSAAARIAAESAAAPRLPDGFRPDPALVKQLGKVMTAQKDRFCDALEAATHDSPVTPQELIDASGMGRSWVFGRLSDLAEIGIVTQVSRKRYALVPGMDVRRGLAEIAERGRRLAREARQMADSR
jgi:hypothetical protein